MGTIVWDSDEINQVEYASPYLKDYANIQRNFRIWCDGEEPPPEEYEKYTDTLMMLLFKHQEYVKLNKFDNASMSLTQYMFITISPPNNVPLDVSHKQFKKFVRKTNFTEYLYVIEQRGECSLTVGTGIHYHTLVKTSYDCFSHLKRDTHSTFKNIINIDNNQINQIINFKVCKDMTDVKNRIEYMTGVKRPESKQERQKYDKLFREKNNLQSYYGKINLPQE